MTAARRLLFLAAILVSLTRGRSAYAGAVRVALIRPSNANAAVAQALTRIEGELIADGFDVVHTDSSANDVVAALKEETHNADAQASIGLFVDTEARTAELLVVDRLTQKTIVRRTPFDAPDSSKAAEILAVRAVELLRASLLELLLEKGPPNAPVAGAEASESTQASTWAAEGLHGSSRSYWAVEAGGAVVGSLDGIGPAILGVFRGRWIFARPLALRATLAGLGTEPRVEASKGTALVAEDFGLLEIVATPWTNTSVLPMVSLGFGALHTGVDGQAMWPYAGRDSEQWAFAADAGVGIEVPLSRQFAVALEAHALFASPYPVVRFLDDEVARGGRPSIVGSVTLVGSP